MRENLCPLQSLRRFVEDELGNAVSIVHILPFYPFTSDDGFSVQDYDAVREDLGTWQDVDGFGPRHDLMFDLVLNHCSASHEWFQQFLRDEEPGDGFFHVLPPDTDLHEVVRPRTHPVLTPFDTPSGSKAVWTTFSEDQVDLNFANPAVLLAFVEILLRYIEKGARMVRLDAIAFLWKSPGTPCIHLPQTHEVVKLFRDILDVAAPEVILLTETNVPHKENVSYFGDGDEAHMVYQFPLPPLLLHALRCGDASALTAWASELEPPPEGCTFFNFTASHDGVGVRPLEGLVSHEQTLILAEEMEALGGKVNYRTRPDGAQTPYELNITYFSALGFPGESPMEHVQRFLLSQTIPLCLQGVPAVYLHSFTATPNDLEGVARTGQNRSINRKQWEWEEIERLLEQKGHPSTWGLCELSARLRARHERIEFHPDVPQNVLNIDPALFVVWRSRPGEKGLVAVHNLGSAVRALEITSGALWKSDAGVQWQGQVLRLPANTFAWLTGVCSETDVQPYPQE